MDALQFDPMRVIELEFGGILDGDHAFLVWESTDDRAEQRTLPRAGGPGDQNVGSSDSHRLEKGPHLSRQPAPADPTRLVDRVLVGKQGEADAIELSDAQCGATNWRKHCVGSTSIGHPGIDQRLVDVDLTPD